MVYRLTFSLTLFLGSLTLGYWLHREHALTEGQAARIVRLVVSRLSPLVLCLLFWKMDLRRPESLLLPLLGALISSSTLLPALIFARRARLSDPQTGSFLTCALFSNVGYFGAFTAFALFGETAYGLCVLYLLFFTPLFYTVGFWIGSHYGRRHTPAGSSSMFKDELRWYPFLGMAVGMLLNLAGIPRPIVFEWFNHLLIPVDTALYLVAIGSQLRLTSPLPWLRPCLAMSAIKFLYAPCIAWLLVTLLGLQGLPRIVVLLQASTPVAVSPLVLPLLFGLDRKLANALWLFSTLAAVFWFLLLIPLLPRL